MLKGGYASLISSESPSIEPFSSVMDGASGMSIMMGGGV